MNSWLIFALFAPVLWGFSNVLDAAIRRNFVKNDSAMTFFLALTRLPFIIVFFIITGFKIPPVQAVIFMLIGGVFWMLPFIFYYKALEFEEPSRVVLLMQTAPIFVLLISFFAINETLTAYQLLAFVLIIVGGVFAAIKKLKGIWRFSKAFWLVIFATFLWAASDVIFKKFEPEFFTFLNGFAFYFLGSFLAAPLLLAVSPDRGKILKSFSGLPRRAWTLLITDQISGISGSLTFAYALTLGKASLTSALISIQPIVVILFSIILSRFIKEVILEDLSKTTLIFKGASLLFILAGLLFLR